MHPTKSRNLKEEILHQAIVECYMQLSKATRPEDDEIPQADLEREEARLKRLDNIVLVDYIKGMCELLYSQVRKQIFSETSSTKVDTKHGVPTVYE